MKNNVPEPICITLIEPNIQHLKNALNALYKIRHIKVDYCPDNELIMAKQAANEAMKNANEVLSELREAMPGFFNRPEAPKIN
jgi:hypothetical protein